MARAAGKMLDLPVQDGQCGMVDHSWLWTRRFDGTPGVKFLDVYCVGRLPQVQLIDTGMTTGNWLWFSHKETRALYRPLDWAKEDRDHTINDLGGLGPLRDDIREDTVEWLLGLMQGGVHGYG